MSIYNRFSKIETIYEKHSLWDQNIYLRDADKTVEFENGTEPPILKLGQNGQFLTI